VHGTEEKFQNSVESRRNVVLWGPKSAREVFPDQQKSNQRGELLS
jgi:hypothetical protein